MVSAVNPSSVFHFDDYCTAAGRHLYLLHVDVCTQLNIQNHVHTRISRLIVCILSRLYCCWLTDSTHLVQLIAGIAYLLSRACSRSLTRLSPVTTPGGTISVIEVMLILSGGQKRFIYEKIWGCCGWNFATQLETVRETFTSILMCRYCCVSLEFESARLCEGQRKVPGAIMKSLRDAFSVPNPMWWRIHVVESNGQY